MIMFLKKLNFLKMNFNMGHKKYYFDTFKSAFKN